MKLLLYYIEQCFILVGSIIIGYSLNNHLLSIGLWFILMTFYYILDQIVD